MCWRVVSLLSPWLLAAGIGELVNGDTRCARELDG